MPADATPELLVAAPGFQNVANRMERNWLAQWIAQPQGAVRINPTGNARLAIAGTGDVLAGWIAARLAAGESAFEAATAAVYLHGLAADRWPPDRALTASALAAAP